MADWASPAAGAEVMGTGIVSIALSLDGVEVVSRILLAIAAFSWAVLAVLGPLRAAGDHARLRADVRSPAALTTVAGTAVLGARLSILGWAPAGIVALALAVILWSALVGPVLLSLERPTVGASLMLTVATEALAVLAALIAVPERADWLLAAALAPFALGLCLYVFVIAHFDLRQLTAGCGDHWITGGALAISTLAAAKLAAGARVLGILGGGGALKDVALALWVLSMLWLPPLLLAELVRVRPRYDVRRWSTVFPFGMYAACSFVLADEASSGAIRGFAQVWVWIAFAVWAVVLVAMVVVAIQQGVGVVARKGRTWAR